MILKYIYIYIYLLLLISMLWHKQAIFESKGDKLSSSAESRIVSDTKSPADWMPTDKLTELSRIKLKNLNSTARPYDQRAFSPLDPTTVWHSHLALAIEMFVVVNFDALAQASDIRIEMGTSCLPLLRAGSEPIRVSDTKSPADWMPTDKPTELIYIYICIHIYIYIYI